MPEHLHVSSSVVATEAEAIAVIPSLIEIMDATIIGDGLRCVGYPPIPTRGVALAEVRSGYRVLAAYQPFFVVGYEENGDAIYEEGWMARVDALCEPITEVSHA